MSVNLYPEMNEKIAGILRVSDEPINLYAAAYIEELKSKLAAVKALGDTMAERIKTNPNHKNTPGYKQAMTELRHALGEQEGQS